MPDLPPLVALLLPPLGIPSLIDLAKIFGVPVALYLLARFVTRRDKLRDETVGEETRLLRKRSETAEQEREALRADSEKNKIEHAHFQGVINELVSTTHRIQTDVQTLKMDLIRSDMRGEASKETLARIDGQLSLLINTYRTLS